MKILALLALMVSPLAAEVYELRTYHANEGKMEGLLARFRDHTTAIFESHGMKNIGYWLTEGEDPKLVYLISHKDELVGRVNHVLKVVKENGFTSYANDIDIVE